jgi:hypothetical protein
MSLGARRFVVAGALLFVSTSALPAFAQAGEARPQPDWTVPGLHALGLMTVMRVSEAYLWPDPFAETDPYVLGFHYQQAFTQPPRWDTSRPLLEADGDRWQINVIGHGLFGSELYLRARTCRKSPGQALAFTLLGSVAWEYGFEANGVRPSALDLTLTPALGLVLGEVRYFGWSSANRMPRGAWRSVLKVVFDPLGELERVAGTPC